MTPQTHIDEVANIDIIVREEKNNVGKITGGWQLPPEVQKKINCRKKTRDPTLPPPPLTLTLISKPCR